MNVLGLLLPMWALLSTTLFSLIDARDESTLSTIYATRLPRKHKPKPVFLFSSKMQAQSPGALIMLLFFVSKFVFLFFILVLEQSSSL